METQGTRVEPEQPRRKKKKDGKKAIEGGGGGDTATLAALRCNTLPPTALCGKKKGQNREPNIKKCDPKKGEKESKRARKNEQL